MTNEVFTGGFDELRDALGKIDDATRALLHITGNWSQGGWMLSIEFLEDLGSKLCRERANVSPPWGDSLSRPPGPLLATEWVLIAHRFEHLFDCWRWLLESPAWQRIPGVFPKRILHLINEEVFHRRMSAEASVTDGNLEEAVAMIAESILAAQTVINGQLPMLRAAIEVMVDGGDAAAAKPASPTAFSADRERWEFARPLRAKGLKWKAVAEQWRRETADPIDAKAFEISCGRAKRAEAKSDAK